MTFPMMPRLLCPSRATFFHAVAGYRAHPETQATRFVFLGCAALLLVVAAYVHLRLWPVNALDDGAGLLACCSGTR
jgi:hypothetical protein